MAEKTPEKIANLDVDPTIGLRGFHFNIIQKKMDLPRKTEVKELSMIMKNL